VHEPVSWRVHRQFLKTAGDHSTFQQPLPDGFMDIDLSANTVQHGMTRLVPQADMQILTGSELTTRTVNVELFCSQLSRKRQISRP
jgi:hypothetical protein